MLFLRCIDMGLFESVVHEFSVLSFMMYSFLLTGYIIQRGMIHEESVLKKYSLFVVCLPIIAVFEIYELLFAHVGIVYIFFFYVVTLSLIVGAILALVINSIGRKIKGK